ncbi:non-homologous end-joining DNA ligase LigD [Pseudochryseolinea flava]|uniref:DNA ligase D polymerase domain-containing protein n=1 Tax=Pseudochryseolinea flava TaxID=2059302 RepID=A0A364Y1P6_9BACT|nr:hypothetical protein [Pseudochryseolinea flava]RAW00658.1 hypothetical protein DQQ10_13800 [Pseudochryseolinea flava]
MLLRKNTKPFKTILHIVKECERRNDREKLIRIYITKAGQSIEERINVEAIPGDAAVFYEMGYETVLSNLESTTHQLHASDDVPGIYFFRSGLSKSWDESPFEFDDAVAKEFKSIPNLPATRKREKVDKINLPMPKLTSEKPVSKKTKPTDKKTLKKYAVVPAQPNFKLKNKLTFTSLDTVIFKQAKLNKEDVLKYYNDMSDYILPFLKDRPISVKLYHDAFRKPVILTTELLEEHGVGEVPSWIKSAHVEISDQPVILVNDREHLLACVELGCIEFCPTPSRIKNIDAPDYIVIQIDSPDYNIAKAIEVARVLKVVLNGLKFPSYMMTNGGSAVHIYLPLDGKTEFESSMLVAEYICKLVHLKIPDLVTLEGAEDYTYGKATLHFLSNNMGQGFIAPYSLTSGETASVATPLLWEEIDDVTMIDNARSETISDRLKQIGNPVDNFMKKKLNANEVVDRMDTHYGFLF